MSTRISWNVGDIVAQIHRCSGFVRHPSTDGFSGWYAKQDLYQIKFLIDQCLDQCPRFAPEDQWLIEQEQKRLIKVLKSPNSP